MGDDQAAVLCEFESVATLAPDFNGVEACFQIFDRHVVQLREWGEHSARYIACVIGGEALWVVKRYVRIG